MTEAVTVMRRPWARQESLDAAALALALCAVGWLDERRASLVLAQYCWLYRGNGDDARELANTLIPALMQAPEDRLPLLCARWLERGKAEAPPATDERAGPAAASQ